MNIHLNKNVLHVQDIGAQVLDKGDATEGGGGDKCPLRFSEKVKNRTLQHFRYLCVGDIEISFSFILNKKNTCFERASILQFKH